MPHVKELVGKEYVKTRKGDNSQYLEIKKLPVEIKRNLLIYVRESLKKQSFEVSRENEESKESDFESEVDKSQTIINYSLVEDEYSGDD